MQQSVVPATAELENALLSTLLEADSLRQGAAALLEALRPALDDASAAIALRDRDGVTLHVLADTGDTQQWPARLDPQVALGAQPAIDPTTGALVVPLRASGRVIGALLFGDPARATELLRHGAMASVIDSAAAVLGTLASRTEHELTRRANCFRSVDAILEGMAHQMANPLTGVSAIAQLLEDDLQDTGHRAAVRQMRQELGRAFGVLNDLLEFQRDTHAQDGILDLAAVVERVARFRAYAIREQGIALHIEIDSSAFIPVRADMRGLEHALLIALRYAELQSHGTVNRRIDVRVRERGATHVAIEIADSGPGNAPDLIPAYFDLPFRGEFPARQSLIDTPDLGLVQSIIRGCSGSIEVASSKADGTTLTLVLPRAVTATTPTPVSNPHIPKRVRS